MRAVATSPAKVILFGEHFVVHGNTAIAMAIALPTKVEVTLTQGRNLMIASNDLDAKASFSTESGNLIAAEGPVNENYLRPVSEVARYVLSRHGAQNRGLAITVTSMAPIGMGL
jgi:mevalonate kinase